MNSPQRILDDRSRDLFVQALDRPPQERAEFLQQVCAGNEALRQQLLQLLAAQVDAGAMFRAETAVAEQPGERIGHYKLLQRIGEGGFGTVWMAEQEEPVRRKVALKVLNPGMDSVQVVGRFEGERQALAMMDHPNIAKVFDGGATPRGRPYFVMELVKGISITKYCDEAGLGLRDRLELFVQVSQAVQHAHQKGVIHRDLKPSNVLVTLHDGKPVPKVIDFGIAKATTGVLTQRTVFTEFRQILGTPDYMAPEQAALSGLDVDTRADIYSLGVLLYELLTGTRPFELQTVLQAGYAEMLRTIKEVDPPKPSTRISTLGEQLMAVAKHRKVHPRSLGSLMRGDLDWIVMKALEKERSRRYETATALADDVLRHLRDEPVLAGPPSGLYRLRKYVRRHHVGMAAGIAIAASLVIGALVAVFGYLEASDQAERARGAEHRAEAALVQERQQTAAALAAQADAKREATKARTALDLVTSMLSSSNPDEDKGWNYPVRLLLADFERALADGPQQDPPPQEPEVEAELRRVAGMSYLGLGMPEAAERNLLRAVQLQRSIHGDRHVDLALALANEAALREVQGRYSDALAVLGQAEAALPGEGSAGEPVLRGTLLQGRMRSLTGLGRFAEAEAVGREALAVVVAHLGNKHGVVIDVLRDLSRTLSSRGRFAEAEATSRQALELARERLGPDHLTVASSMCSLAAVLGRRGDLAGAEELCRQALTIKEQRLSRGHPDVARELEHLAGILRDRGDLSGGEAQYRRALEIYRESGGDGPSVARALAGLGDILQSRGQFAEAQALTDEALALLRRLLDAGQPITNTSLNNLGVILANLAVLGQSGSRAEAEALFARALEIAREPGSGDPLGEADILNNLAQVQRMAGRLAEAEDSVGQALTIRTSVLGEEHPSVAESLHVLAAILEDGGKLVEAEARSRRALAIRQSMLGGEHPEVAASLRQLGPILERRGDLAAAEDASRRSLDLHRKLFGDEHPFVAEGLNSLAGILVDRDKLTEAEDFFRRALALQQKLVGTEHKATATCAHNLATVLNGRGEHDAAEPLFRDALATRQKLLGAEDPQVAQCLVGLGVSLKERGRLADAEEAFRRALPILEKHKTKDHAACLQGLGHIFLQRGELDAAEELVRRALAINEELSGAESPSVATSLSLLAVVLHARRDLVAAEDVAAQCLAMARKLHDDQPLEIAHPLVNLGAILQARGDLVGAEARLREALAIREKLLGSEHQDVDDVLGRLSTVLRRAGQLREAEGFARRTLALAQQNHGADSTQAASKLASLASILLLQDRPQDAEPIARECLAIRAAKLAGSWQHYNATALLARALLHEDRLAEAEPLLVQACTHMQPPPDATHHLREALTALITLYERQGRADDAAPWRTRLQTFEPAEGKR